MTIACVSIPCFQLRVAAGQSWQADSPCVRLEGIAAAVEADRQGEAFFDVDGLRGLYGNDASGVLAVARRSVGLPVTIGGVPVRFAVALVAEGRPARVGSTRARKCLRSAAASSRS